MWFLSAETTFLFYNVYLYANKFFPMPKITLKQIAFLFGLILLVTSCGTQRTASSSLYNPKQVAELSNKLGIELKNTDKEDDKNIPLYAEASLWLGTPYRYGGLSKKGVDCSGLTYLLYQKVYKKKIPRSTADLSKMNMQKVSKSNLRAGDLVFFTTNSSHKKINHVGIYLKDNRFIHASTSRGVVVDRLDQGYYSRKDVWKMGGRIK